MAEAQQYREKLIEKVSEHDDALLEKYLHGQEITEEEIKKALRDRVIKSVYHEDTAFVVVICGTAFKNKGVQPLLDAVVDYLPSPLDVPAISGLDPNAKEETLDRAARGRRCAVLGAGVQADDRPVRRSAHVHPCVLGRADVRLSGLQRDQGQDRTRRPPPEDARQQA